MSSTIRNAGWVAALPTFDVPELAEAAPLITTVPAVKVPT